MEQSLRSTLLLLLLTSPLASAAVLSSFPSSSSSTSLARFSTEPSTGSSGIEDQVEVIWIFPQPSGGHVWSTQTFVPTTYSEFASLSTAVVTSTIVTVQDSKTTQLSTYSYLIGPNGVGWSIPSTSRNSATVLLPVPTYLPGQKPVEQ